MTRADDLGDNAALAPNDALGDLHGALAARRVTTYEASNLALRLRTESRFDYGGLDESATEAADLIEKIVADRDALLATLELSSKAPAIDVWLPDTSLNCPGGTESRYGWFVRALREKQGDEKG